MIIVPTERFFFVFFPRIGKGSLETLFEEGLAEEMAFFPKDEYVPRRGVAMKIKEPETEKLVGEHRDSKIAREVKVFTGGEFVLNKALEATPPEVNKVKTFDRRAGEHNVIAHEPEPFPQPHPRLRPPLSDEMLRRLTRNGAQVDKEYAQQRMELSRGMVEQLSVQRPEKFHKHTPTPVPVRRPVEDIVGFKGLGKTSIDSPRAKHKVTREVYDPLRMKFPLMDWRDAKPQGVRTLIPTSLQTTVQDHLLYGDGANMDDLRKRVVHHPHIHQFPVNYTADQDIGGFSGLGVSDRPPNGTGKRYIASTDHSTNASPYATKAPYRVPPMASPSPSPSHGYAHSAPSSTPQPLPPPSAFYQTNESQIQLAPSPQYRFSSDFKK